MTTVSTTLHKLFKSTTPFLTIVSPTGENLEFVGGSYHTDDPKNISFLMGEVKVIGAGKSKHPLIYVDADNQEVNPDELTPMAQLRAKLKAELLQEMASATDKENDMGNYDNSKSFATSINNSNKVESATPVATFSVGVGASALQKIKDAQAAKEAGVNAVIVPETPTETTNPAPTE